MNPKQIMAEAVQAFNTHVSTRTNTKCLTCENGFITIQKPNQPAISAKCVVCKGTAQIDLTDLEARKSYKTDFVGRLIMCDCDACGEIPVTNCDGCLDNPHSHCLSCGKITRISI